MDLARRIQSASISTALKVIPVSVEKYGWPVPPAKKFSATDSKILKEAEKRVYQEFSYVLNTDEKNIPEFILKYLNV